MTDQELDATVVMTDVELAELIAENNRLRAELRLAKVRLALKVGSTILLRMLVWGHAVVILAFLILMGRVTFTESYEFCRELQRRLRMNLPP